MHAPPLPDRFCARLRRHAALAQDKSIVSPRRPRPGLRPVRHILPLFKAKTGIDVKVIAQGTGQALDTARRGDADVVFVHARPQRRNSSPKASA
jgi:tungstate transport system substrate-binding protein